MFRQRVRVRFEKKGELRAISHLDLMRAFERALRRTGLPLRASEGYNPRPRISFPVPLGVGIEGRDEVMEFDLGDWESPSEIERKVREQLPEGLTLKSLVLVDAGKAVRAEEVTYIVTPGSGVRNDARVSPAALDAFLAREEVLVRRIRKGKEKTVNVRPFVLSLHSEGGEIILRAKAGPEGSTRPEEIFGALGFDEAARAQFRIVRSRVQLAD